tara:strand:- start:89719 stop:90693 length:975 start_codon:yes stop_codon:yes gene_type:complete
MTNKATAKAHAMQGLLKYHGMKDSELRIPFHDSISVCLDSLFTKTTVEFGNFEKDELIINNEMQQGTVLDRALSIINKVRLLSEIDDKVKITSENSIKFGEVKGLGFSSSAGAALAGAAFKASGLEAKHGWDIKLISRIARLLAGSACRSVAGEYARWYSGNDDESSYAKKISTRSDLDLKMIAIPFPSDYTTESAHKEVLTSNFFDARIKSANIRLEKIQKAIKSGDLDNLGKLVEEDSLELHALTMTGKDRVILFRSETIDIINFVKKKQKDNIPVYYSMQTGPSIFINTNSDYIDEVYSEISEMGFNGIKSSVGDSVKIEN